MDYLCIGHICQDKVVGGYTLGGSASYCSITAHLLGKKAGVITSYGEDFQFLSAFADIAIHRVPSAKTTIFKNDYLKKIRTQYIYDRAATIYQADLPKKWLNVPLVHLGPIADEVDFSIINAFSPATLIAATPQGWMRQWNTQTGRISPKVLDWNQLLEVDILILSDEDIIGYEDLFPGIIANIPIVVLTRGSAPASAFYDGYKVDFPAYPTEVIDATGAGDTFATGFLLKYLETKEIDKAMAYGHVVASFCVAGKGLEGLKNLEQVEERYQTYLKDYL